jgi:hypothetical protein
VYGIYSYNQDIIKRAIEHGFQSGKKAQTAVIPEHIFSQNNKVLIAIVRGLSDTDGTFYCQRSYGKQSNAFRKIFHCYPKLDFVSISIQLLEQIKQILKLINIPSTIRGGHKEGLINNRHCQRSYRLTIYRINDIIRFFELIRPANPKHQTKYNIWKKFGFLPPNTNIQERRKILKKEISPYIYYYAGVPERSNGLDSFIT